MKRDLDMVNEDDVCDHLVSWNKKRMCIWIKRCSTKIREEGDLIAKKGPLQRLAVGRTFQAESRLKPIEANCNTTFEHAKKI